MEPLSKEVFAALSPIEQIVQLEQVDAKTRQRLIVSSRNSLTLTRSLSSEKLFYTLKEIGLADAVDLLALASPEQLRDMIDLDCWRKDTVDDRRIASWLMLLDEAGSGKLAEWALHVDVELLVLLVKRHFEVVRKIEIEEDPDFNQSRYFTFDDQYLLRFIGEEEPILSLVLERMRVLDYDAYKQILEWSLLELDSSLEEDALRWRNARLADRGYPPYDEAQNVFRFVAPESIVLERYRRAAAAKVRYAEDEAVTPADHALMLLDVRDSLFVRALAGVSSEPVESLRHELAMLMNEVVVAEACDPGELAEVRKCAEEVHDYVNIGLAYVAHEDEAQAVRLLEDTLLRPIFQVGVSVTLRLQEHAREMDAILRQRVGETWEELLDSPFREACAYARRRPPLFFRGLEIPGEIFFRRFRTREEVARVETVLDHTPLWFAVLQRWRLLPEQLTGGQASLATLWNTALVHWAVNGQVSRAPLTQAKFIAFQKKLRGSSIAEEMARFQAFATASLSLSTKEKAALRALADFAGERLEEAVAIDATVSDARFIEGILLEHIYS